MQSNWIGNRPVPGSGGEIAILNPATQEFIDSIPKGTQQGAGRKLGTVQLKRPQARLRC